MSNSNERTVIVKDLGRMAYAPALEEQRRHAQILMDRAPGAPDGFLLTVEHDPVLTVGRRAGENDLGRSEAEWNRLGVEVYRTDRGGMVTWHGPGQVVLYPILNLKRFGLDLPTYVRGLEQLVMDFLKSRGVESRRDPEHTGVWIGSDKIAAIGVHIRRWITTHGVAINIVNDLDVYRRFVPCGIRDKGVTSLSSVTGKTENLSGAREGLIRAFETQFQARLKIEP